MGIAALILGIISLLVSLTIFLDLSLILGVLAIVLGIISVVKKKSKELAIAGIVLGALGLIICFSTDTPSDTSGTGITNDSGNGTQTVKVTTDKVKMEKVGLTKAGDYVIKVTNNNEGSVCLSSITANFKDSNGNFAKSLEADNSFVVIPAKSYTYVYIWGYDENLSQYADVTFATELANISEDFAASGIELKSNNTGSQIAVTAKNTTGKTIESCTVVVLYYQGDTIVGVESGYSDGSTPDGSEAYINVEYPTDSDYDDVSFDKYEVYYINASYEY